MTAIQFPSRAREWGFSFDGATAPSWDAGKQHIRLICASIFVQGFPTSLRLSTDKRTPTTLRAAGEVVLASSPVCKAKGFCVSECMLEGWTQHVAGTLLNGFTLLHNGSQEAGLEQCIQDFSLRAAQAPTFAAADLWYRCLRFNLQKARH